MKNNDLKYTYQLPCIVPVSNVEQYIEDCVESLLKTLLDEIEIIWVGDVVMDSLGSLLDCCSGTNSGFIRY